MSEQNLEALDQLVQDLKAGMPLTKAWSQRADSQEFDPQLKGQVVELISLCRSLGASPAQALERLLEVCRQAQEFDAELDAEWATPKATMRLVVWLPVGFIALAQALGLPIVQSVAVSSLAKGAVLAGAFLLLAARAWSARILRKAAPRQDAVAQQIDLVAIGLSAGLSFDKALGKAKAHAEVGQLLMQERMLSRTTGAPIAKLALNRAQRLRVLAQRQNRLRIREAAVSLMWPLGVAVLPALILLLVVPLSIGFANQNPQ